MKSKNKKTTYVRPHMRRNTKRAGTHMVKGHYRRLGGSDMPESQRILREELKNELEGMDPDDFDITEEDKEMFEKEELIAKATMNKLKRKRKNASSKKKYAEALADELRTAFGESEDNVYVRKSDSGYEIIAHGLPYRWAVEMTGYDKYYGIKGYNDDPYFLEPVRGYILGVYDE